MANIWDVGTHLSHDQSKRRMSAGRLLFARLHRSLIDWLPLLLMIAVIVFIVRDSF